jgi:hypothetical protein
VEEDDAEVGAVVVRLDDVTAVHVGVAAGLVHEEPPHVIESLERIAALVENRRAAQPVDPGRDDAERLARAVVVDGADLHRLDPRRGRGAGIRRRAWTLSASGVEYRSTGSCRSGW